MRTTRFALAAALALPPLAFAQAPGGTDPRAGKGFIATPVFSAEEDRGAPRPLRGPARRRRDRRHGRGGPPERGPDGPGGAAAVERHGRLHPPVHRHRGDGTLRPDAAAAGGEEARRGVRSGPATGTTRSRREPLPGPAPAGHRARHRGRRAGRRGLHRLQQYPVLEELAGRWASSPTPRRATRTRSSPRRCRSISVAWAAASGRDGTRSSPSTVPSSGRRACRPRRRDCGRRRQCPRRSPGGRGRRGPLREAHPRGRQGGAARALPEAGPSTGPLDQVGGKGAATPHGGSQRPVVIESPRERPPRPCRSRARSRAPCGTRYTAIITSAAAIVAPRATRSRGSLRRPRTATAATQASHMASVLLSVRSPPNGQPVQ